MAELKIVKGESNHGGARPGAGRRPKALRYASELAQAEEKIMSALPAAIEALENAAKAGDVAAAKYLLDRAFGRVQTQAAPLAEDKALPYCEADLERDISNWVWADSLNPLPLI
jgi:hypothetical protein